MEKPVEEKLILCANANSAVDKTVIIENYRLNAIHRPSEELVLPGGKGVNVARVARALGQPALVAGWIGGHAGRFIEEALRDEGIQSALIPVAGESRECFSVVDPVNGTLTEVYEKGPIISARDLDAFYSLFQELLPRAAAATVSGSLPRGVPADFYARLVCMARAAGVYCALDAYGEALRIGVEEGRPDLLKCNRSELSELAGRPLETLDEVRAAIRGLAGRKCPLVVITLGAVGAIALDGERTWLAEAPRVQAVSAVGSGDAFLAGLLRGILAHQPFEQSLRLATAAGAANTLQIGAGRLRAADVETLLDQVKITEE